MNKSRPRKKGRRQWWWGVLVAVTILVVAIMTVALLQTNPSGTESDIVSTSVADMIVEQDDLPAGWQMASPYQPGYQGTLPGECSEVWGISLNYTEGGQQKLVGTFVLMKCANVSSAMGLFDVSVTMTETNTGLTMENATIGQEDKGVAYSGSISIMFREKNSVCLATFIPIGGYSFTTAQAIELAQTQVDRIA